MRAAYHPQKAIKLFALVLIVAALAGLSEALLNDDLVHVYKFEGDANDSIRTGTPWDWDSCPQGGPTYAPGRSGNAGVFDTNKGLRIADTASFRDVLSYNGGGLTHCEWINTSTVSGDQQTIFNPTTVENSIILSNKWYGGWWDGSTNHLFNYGTDLANGNWRHLCLVFDGVNDLGLAYLDGVNVANTSSLTIVSCLGGSDFCRGSGLGMGTNSPPQACSVGSAWFMGQIDELTVWNSTRSASEIRRLATGVYTDSSGHFTERVVWDGQVMCGVSLAGDWANGMNMWVLQGSEMNVTTSNYFALEFLSGNGGSDYGIGNCMFCQKNTFVSGSASCVPGTNVSVKYGGSRYPSFTGTNQKLVSDYISYPSGLNNTASYIIACQDRPAPNDGYSTYGLSCSNQSKQRGCNLGSGYDVDTITFTGCSGYSAASNPRFITRVIVDTAPPTPPVPVFNVTVSLNVSSSYNYTGFPGRFTDLLVTGTFINQTLLCEMRWNVTQVSCANVTFSIGNSSLVSQCDVSASFIGQATLYAYCNATTLKVNSSVYPVSLNVTIIQTSEIWNGQSICNSVLQTDYGNFMNVFKLQGTELSAANETSVYLEFLAGHDATQFNYEKCMICLFQNESPTTFACVPGTNKSIYFGGQRNPGFTVADQKKISDLITLPYGLARGQNYWVVCQEGLVNGGYGTYGTGCANQTRLRGCTTPAGYNVDAISFSGCSGYSTTLNPRLLTRVLIAITPYVFVNASTCPSMNPIIYVPDIHYFNLSTNTLTQYGIMPENQSLCGYTYQVLVSGIGTVEAKTNLTGASYVWNVNNVALSSSYKVVLNATAAGLTNLSSTFSYVSANSAPPSWDITWR